MLALALSPTTLNFITFCVMLGASVLGYFSLRRHVRRIQLPEETDEVTSQAVDEDVVADEGRALTP